jgi:DNA/RNA-binding domain of Phe-tRNA-synthetase-like protein
VADREEAEEKETAEAGITAGIGSGRVRPPVFMEGEYFMFVVSERWRNAYPDATVAMLVVRGVAHVREHPALEERKRALEAELRSRFADPEDIRSDRVIRMYTAYYRRFEKTYHVAGQLKTAVVKQRPLPTVSGLVDVMFMAEMKNLLLTAGHDLAAVAPPVTLDAATGEESYTKLNQESQVARAGDMMTVDAVGILSSVIHGPDYRSRISPETRDALYVTYAPDGITREELLAHLGDIRESILLFSPSSGFEPVRILSAQGIEDVEL